MGPGRPRVAMAGVEIRLARTQNTIVGQAALNGLVLLAFLAAVRGVGRAVASLTEGSLLGAPFTCWRPSRCGPTKPYRRSQRPRRCDL